MGDIRGGSNGVVEDIAVKNSITFCQDRSFAVVVVYEPN